MDDENFLDLFVEEVGEHLDALNKEVLALEEEGDHSETVNSLMRAAHTIKGAAMLMNFDPMARLAHAMEHRLREEMKLDRKVPATLVDLLLEGARIIDDMISEAREAGGLEAVEDRAEWTALTERIQDAVIEHEEEPAADAGAGEPAAGAPVAAPEAVPPPVEAEAEPPAPASEAEMERQLRAALAGEEPATEPTAVPTLEPATEPTAEPIAPADPPAQAPTKTAGGQRSPVIKEQIKISVEKVDQLNDLVGELLIYQARLEAKEETLREITRRLDGLVSVSERAKLFGLSPLPPAVQEIQEEMNDYVEELSADLVELNYLGAEIRGRSLQIRMLPASTLLQEFRLAVRDLRRRLGKEAELVIDGGEIELDKRLLEELRPAILHIIRNSMDHGIEPPEERVRAGKPRAGSIRIVVRVEGARVHIGIDDDGRGMDAERIREKAVEAGLITPESATTISDEEALYLVMQPGFSTTDKVTDVSGRGVGMDVVRAQVEDLKGAIKIDTRLGEGTSFLLDLPLTLSTAQVLMVDVAGQTFAIPIGYVEETLLLSPVDIYREGGRPVFRLRDRTLGLYVMQDFLTGLDARTRSPHGNLHVVLLHGRGQRVGFQVTRFLEQAEVVVKTLGTFIDSVSYISGATILGDGKPALILDVPDLLSSLALRRAGPGTHRTRESVSSLLTRPRGGRVLVVDDSVTTRALEKGILESYGYKVLTASNGNEALEVLRSETVDLLLTDIDMPGMDGIDLCKRVRATSELSHLPIVICSSQSSEADKRLGLEAGAQAYIVKRELDQENLCSMVEKLMR